METNSNPTPVTPQPEQTTPPQSPQAENKNTGMAALAYLGILIIIPLLVAKEHPFVKFHIKQGLVVLAMMVVSWLVGIVPMLGWLLGALLWIGSVILMIVGIVNALNGKEEPLPVVGHLSDKFHF